MSEELEMNSCNYKHDLDPDYSNIFRFSTTLGIVALSWMLYSIFAIAIS